MANEKPFSSESIKGIGNVGADPKRISGSDKMNVVVIPVAANYRGVDADRNTFEETVWRDLKAFGRDADRALESIKKGDRVKYEGRLVPNLYVNKDGEEVLKWNVDIEFDGITIVPSDGGERGGSGGTRTRNKPSRGRSSRTRDEDYDDDDEEFEEKPKRSRSAKPKRSRRAAEPEDVDDVDDVDEDFDLEDEKPAPKKRASRSRTRSRSADVDDDVDEWAEKVL